ncbi:MAG: DUF2156 domain-containing protein [Microbacteriaceae bacterium]
MARRNIASAGWALVRSRPVTAALFLLILVLAIATGPLHGPHHGIRAVLGTGYESVVEQGHWWSPLTAVFFTGNLFELIVALALLTVLLGVAEGLLGPWRTIVAFVATAIGGTIAGVALQILGVRIGELWAHNVIELITFDPLTGVAGTLMAASAFASVLWRRRIRVLTVLTCVMFLLYSGQPSDLYRVMAVLLGLALGVAYRPVGRVVTWVRSSHREVRVLLAAVVAITAVGPVISLLSYSRFGPLAPIGLLLSNDVPDVGTVLDRCQALRITRGCLREITLERISGFGPVLVSVLPLLILLVAAYGLLRGSRFAAWLAIAVNAMLALLAGFYFGFLPVAGTAPAARSAALGGRFVSGELLSALAASVLVPVAIAAALVFFLPHFTVFVSRRRAARFVVTVLVAAGSLSIAYIGLGWLLRDGFSRSVTIGDLLADLPERFIPVSFLRAEHLDFVPVAPANEILYHGVGVLFWLIIILAAIRPVLAGRARQVGGNAFRVRAMLAHGGGDAISHMATWRGNSYWFDPAEDTAIAYRVVNAVAITTGEPFGARLDLDAVVRRFARFCDDNGWVTAFYSVGAGLTPIFAAMGWETMTVAEETLIRPQQWDTAGKRWQDVRSSIHRAQRAGIHSEWVRFNELPLATAGQISEISEEWVAERGLPEMGFTLGGLDELRDPDVRLMLAIGRDGRVQAVTSWLPSFREGRLVGWTLDFMRRRPGSINGIMEYLIAEAATRMGRDGIEFMSLSAAPLAHTAVLSGDSSVMNRVLGFLSTSLEPAYGFRSLLRFKRKFQPEFRPLVMAYADPVALPRIGLALARAYLPALSVRHAARLMMLR